MALTALMLAAIFPANTAVAQSIAATSYDGAYSADFGSSWAGGGQGGASVHRDGAEQSIGFIDFPIPGGRTYSGVSLQLYVDSYGQDAVLLVKDAQGIDAGALNSGTLLETSTTYGSLSAAMPGGVLNVALSAAAVQRMNDISSQGGGTFSIGFRTPTEGGYMALGSARLAAAASPTLTSISPNFGPADGGTSVILTGTSLANVHGVSFGGNDASSFVVNTDTQITAVAPPGSGVINVRVASPDGVSATAVGNQFTYHSPTITSVTVSGTTASIAGTFTPGQSAGIFIYSADDPTTSLAFGPVMTNASGVWSISLDMSGLPSGGYQASLYDYDVDSGVAFRSFTYNAPPTISFIGPVSGSTSGGTQVEILGSGFAGATAVNFGANPSTNFAIQSDSEIIATSPAGTGSVSVTVTGPSGTSNGSSYTYFAMPTVTSLSPTAGAQVSGTSVVVTGTNFTGATAVQFGGTAAISFTVNSATQITAVAPAGTGPVNVRVTTPGGVSAAAPGNLYTYQGTISVVSNATNLSPGSVATVTVTPSVAPPSGSLVITLNASGSAGGTLSTSTLTFTDASPQTFTYTAGAPSGPKTISYALGGASGGAYTAPASTGFAVASRTITVTGAPSSMTAGQVATVTVTPSAAPPSGNLVVNLSKSGSGTLSTSSLTFTSAAPQTFTYTAAAPAGTVTLNFEPSGTDALAYSAPPAVNISVTAPLPTVSSVSPSIGPAAGGTAITITGTGFTGATGVTVGGAPATAVTVVSDTQITATTPAGTMGQASVVVTNAAGSNGANTLYRYLGAPTANDQSRSVAQNTATAITLTGSDPNTPPRTLVYVVTSQPQGSLSGAAPNLTYTPSANFTGTDSFTFTVSNGGSTSAPATVTLTVLGAPPSISFLGPNSGSDAGGTPVTIFGSGFTGATAVTFGVNPSTNFSIQGDNQIIATSPAGTGSVSVTVTTPNGTSGGSTYTYVAAPTVSSVSPAEGIADATNRPANVTITGSNFSASGNTVAFGGTQGTIVSESTTSIVVTPPANATGGLVNVDVVNASFRSGTAFSAYRYILPPTVTVNFSPDAINIGSGRTIFTVTLTNPNGVALQNVAVASNGANTPFSLTAFGGSCGSGSYSANSGFRLNGTTLAAGASCTVTPEQEATSTGAFQFVTNAPTSTGTPTTALSLTGVAATSNTVNVFGPPTISAISPTSGPLAGGQAVTLTGTNFNGATAVTIGGVAATNVTVVSATSITATTPPGGSGGSKTVSVTGPAGTGQRANGFLYLPPPSAPTITAPLNDANYSRQTPFVYAGADAPIGSTVTLYVDGVSIGTTVVNAATWSLSNPTPLSLGSHTVYATVTTAAGTSAASPTTTFNIVPVVPAVAEITPNFGISTGGDVVQIVGENMGQATSVLFGTTPGTDLQIIDDDTLSVRTPAGQAGTVAVTVTNPEGTSPNSGASSFTYHAPSVSVSTDGTRATFSGTFVPSRAFRLLTVFGDDQFDRQVTADSSGQWQTIVDLPYVGSWTAQMASVGFVRYPSTLISFVAGERPVVSSVNPTAGSLAGGTSVSLVGSGFSGATGVSFGTTPAASFTVNSDTSITAVSPAGAAGAINVTVTNPGGTSVPGAGSTFTYAALPAAPTITTPSNGATTSDLPTYSGSAAGDGVMVSVWLDGERIGEVAPSAGAWSLRPSARLLPGAHVVYATTTLGGLSSDPSASVAFTVEATAPETPSIDGPEEGSTRSPGNIQLYGTAELAVDVFVTLDGQVIQALRDGAYWYYDTPADLSEGEHVFTVQARTAAGLTSPASAQRRFIVDGIGPQAPVVLSPADGSTVVVPRPVIRGTAEAGGTVRLRLSGEGSGEEGGGRRVDIDVGADGQWSFTPTQDLALGANSIELSSSDAAGNRCDCTVIVDFTYALMAVGGELTDGRVGVVYSATLRANGGTAPVVFEVASGALPDGLALSASGVLSGTPTASGDYTVTIRATAADGATAERAFPISIDRPAPPEVVDVEDVEVTVNTDGTTNETTIDLGPAVRNAVRIEIVTPPSFGTATVDGLQVVYTPRPGYFGTDQFTYRAVGYDDPNASLAGDVATKDSGALAAETVSATATVSLSIPAPTLVLAGGALPGGDGGTAYSQTLSASGGTAPYTYALTGGALPTGLTLSSGGVISGAPTTGGTFTFTVTATDSSTGTGPFSVSAARQITVTAVALTVTPSTLADGTRGQTYNQSLSTSGGVGPYSYAVVSGALPAGLSLSSTGQIAGTPTAVGTFNVQVRSTDSASASAVASLGLTIVSAAITVTPTDLPEVMAGVPYSQRLQAAGGLGPYVFAISAGDLPLGLTLTSAGLLSGRPAAAGTFSFTVSATDSVGNVGTAAVTQVVRARPDPSADPDVRGLNTAQAEATRRLVGTQLDTFGRRLEQLHSGAEGQPDLSVNLRLDGSAFTPTETDPTRARSGRPASAFEGSDHRDQADLEALNTMVWGGRRDTSTAVDAPDERRNVAQTSGGPGSGPRVWAGGAISLGERDATTRSAELSITTSGVSAGLDVSVSDTLDLGVGVGFGQENTDVGSDGSRMEADTWLGVGYGSWRPAGAVFFDGMVGYGELGFDTRRRTSVDATMVFGGRDGSVWFGSLAAGLDRAQGTTRWIGYGRVDLLDAELDAYVETGSPLWALSYDARDISSRQAALGLRYERTLTGRDSRWTPGARLEFSHEFGDVGAQRLRYADWLDGPGFSIGDDGWERSRLRLGLSLGWAGVGGWAWASEYEASVTDREILNSLRLKLSRTF